jgi:uncharacterized coiled-coil DUF342 family protein
MFKWLKKNYPLFIIIGACIIAFNFFGEKEDYVNEYNAKIKALEAKVDSLHSENNELVNESKLLEEQIAGYDEKIKNLNIKINVIKNETKQKVDAVDFFGDDELERFFAERYKHILEGQHQDTIN